MKTYFIKLSDIEYEDKTWGIISINTEIIREVEGIVEGEKALKILKEIPNLKDIAKDNPVIVSLYSEYNIEDFKIMKPKYSIFTEPLNFNFLNSFFFFDEEDIEEGEDFVIFDSVPNDIKVYTYIALKKYMK